ncbi:hypothetical protein HY408_01130 [Candidatus Gottesmanbacteria bacterium]|nr:hypothetical protein [Candidatus Gottesmanbacteria bacterium]
MGVVNTILRSKTDSHKPHKKSYWGYHLNVRLIDTHKLTGKTTLLPAEKRMVAHELSGKEPVEKVIVLTSSGRGTGHLTTHQIKEILSDLGFNVDTILGRRHHADIHAVMNINGFVLPGWETLVRLISKRRPAIEKLISAKLAPGYERLHIRLYVMHDGSWLITAHIDGNWMNINLAKVVASHFKTGSGDYRTGTTLMYQLLRKFNRCLLANQIIRHEDITRITRRVYYGMFTQNIATAIMHSQF